MESLALVILSLATSIRQRVTYSIGDTPTVSLNLPPLSSSGGDTLPDDSVAGFRRSVAAPDDSRACGNGWIKLLDSSSSVELQAKVT